MNYKPRPWRDLFTFLWIAGWALAVLISNFG